MSSNPKRASYFEEELITVKPSTELIPDEYEHFQETQYKIVLHTFVANDEYCMNLEQEFLKTLEYIEFETGSTNRHNLETDNFPKIMNEIAKGPNTNDAGLILFFAGFTKPTSPGQLEIFDGIKQDTINIQQIWSKFDSYNCPGLKNKPKIFIFALSTPETPIQRDGKKHFKTAYDTPAEADILVIYNNPISGSGNFLQNFCENIRLFGKTENIITLASCTPSTSTLIISTLTRNFYFTVSNLRGHHHIIDKHNDEIKAHIKEIKETFEQKTIKETFEQKTVKKEKRNFLDRILGSKPSSSTNPSLRENIEPSRTRHVSLTEYDGGRPNLRRKSEKSEKPRWRP